MKFKIGDYIRYCGKYEGEYNESYRIFDKNLYGVVMGCDRYGDYIVSFPEVKECEDFCDGIAFHSCRKYLQQENGLFIFTSNKYDSRFGEYHWEICDGPIFWRLE